jgi:putative membrane protein
METLVTYALPWEFSPTVLLGCALAVIGYARGVRSLHRRGEQVNPWRCVSFLLGLLSSYAVLQTYFDFLAQHMFWVHRLQHLVLHHIAPILLIAGTPGRVLAQGVPERWRQRALLAAPRLRWLGQAFRFVQHPVVASVLFVGLIYFWLIPTVHFTAMLDARRYRLMNWSMAVDGLLFWWLILTPKRASGSGSVGYGLRVLMLCFVALLQILIGAYITLHKEILFDVYAVCGRAWAISPLVDQQLGGLLTWIPAAMMSGVGLLIVLHHVLHEASPQAIPLTEAEKS